MHSPQKTDLLSPLDRQTLESFADTLAENNYSYWKSLQLKSGSIVNILAEVEFSNNALNSQRIKVHGWKIIRQQPVRIWTLEEALDVYEKSTEIISFLKQLPFGCIGVIMILQAPKGAGIFTYGFPV